MEHSRIKRIMSLWFLRESRPKAAHESVANATTFRELWKNTQVGDLNQREGGGLKQVTLELNFEDWTRGG